MTSATGDRREHLSDYLEDVASCDGTKPFIIPRGQGDNNEGAVTYADAVVRARSLAWDLKSAGIAAGDRIGVDVRVCSDLVTLLLAADLLGATLVFVNRRLAPAARLSRLRSVDVRMTVDDDWFSVRDDVRRRQALMPLETDRSVVPLVIMFTSGTTGQAKAVPLSASNLIGSALAGNIRLSCDTGSLWQLVLPMYHVGGLQIAVRTLVAHATMLLYPSFSPELVLSDAAAYHPTHLSTVDAMLRRLLETDGGALAGYRAILNAGGPISQALIERCAGLPLYVSYGSTETCSQAATSLATEYVAHGLEPLEGYSFKIVSPDGRGHGQIAVAGPGVFKGYLGVPDASASFTPDGYFLTGDTGSLEGDRLRVDERLSDLFISGGENIYPAEIEQELVKLPGVAEAAVIGVPDERWGRVPFAFITGGYAADLTTHGAGASSGGAGLSSYGAGATERAIDLGVRERLSERIGRFQMPREVMAVTTLPRTSLGKVDRACLARWAEAPSIRIRGVRVRRISQPLVSPFVTSKVDLRRRDSLVIEVEDDDSNRGLGECVAFDKPWYVDETIDADEAALRDVLIPRVLDRGYRRPEEVAHDLLSICGLPMAVAALEMAVWDLYGHMTGTSLGDLIGGVRDEVPSGVVAGIMSVDATLAFVERQVEEGIRRVKLKIRPGDDRRRVEAVRTRWPDLLLTADANRSYDPGRAEDVASLLALDRFGLLCIEEPLKDASPDELEAFQQHLSTPICLDESISTPAQVREALHHRGLSWLNMKAGLLGGVEPFLELYRRGVVEQRTLMVGGMYETGVSKRLHAILEALPAITIPGDISSTSRYFSHDVTVPPFIVKDGMIALGAAPGLGIMLDEEEMERITRYGWKVPGDGFLG